MIFALHQNILKNLNTHTTSQMLNRDHSRLNGNSNEFLNTIPRTIIILLYWLPVCYMKKETHQLLTSSKLMNAMDPYI